MIKFAVLTVCILFFFAFMNAFLDLDQILTLHKFRNLFIYAKFDGLSVCLLSSKFINKQINIFVSSTVQIWLSDIWFAHNVYCAWFKVNLSIVKLYWFVCVCVIRQDEEKRRKTGEMLQNTFIDLCSGFFWCYFYWFKNKNAFS